MKPSTRGHKVLKSENLRMRDAAGFRLVETVYPSGLKMPAHVHEPAYFSFVLRGAYTEKCGRLVRSCVPSILIFHPADGSHAVSFHDADVSIFRIEIKPQKLEHLRQYSTVLLDASRDFRGGLVASLSLRLYREFQEDDAFSPLAMEGLVLEIVAEAARRALRSPAGTRPRWLMRAREILHEQPCDPLTLSALAAEVGVNPVYLARSFRRHYRCTVGEYLRRLRIETACREISSTEKSLSEIAASSGFCDQSHFSNAFKRYTGMTPAEFRARLRRS